MSETTSLDGLRQVIRHHWGFPDFRPLQEPAMRAALEGRDSLVVMPTGGGKSLCYQAPAVHRGGLTLVVSPLIALMKDQVDGLQRFGVPAVSLDSSLSPADRFANEQDVREGKIRLLFVSPERLVQPDFQQLLRQADLKALAIDEAHCISHWGHDFRPEYRQLSRLRDSFPNTSLHAFTATATESVRRDIIHQLQLREPAVLVGNFDRPNLTYRVLPRMDRMKQVREVLDRHQGEAGIVYCLRRSDVDELSAALTGHGYNARPYHAGMDPITRREAQEAFTSEQVDIIVATVAFGMGIDRSNVRFVVHAAMPKSLEHYQQETGRAGRDGLEAECVLLYSGGDFMSMKSIVEKSAAEANAEPEFVRASIAHLEDMNRYCRGATCRHKSLVEYFNQSYDKASCEACDHCLGDTHEVPEPVVIAQKILSCVARVKQRFGIGHVIGVLRGDTSEMIRKWKHEELTTYGILSGTAKPMLRDWIYQLIEQKVLAQSTGDYPVLVLNDASWEVMRGEREVRLIQLASRGRGEGPKKSEAAVVSWEGVDEALFEELRKLRRDLANEAQVPPYRIFSDAVLREMARRRPSTLERMHRISGIGDVKLQAYGQQFLDIILKQGNARSLELDVSAPGSTPSQLPLAPAPTKSQEDAFPHFRKGESIEAVMKVLGRARATVIEYLAQYIMRERPESISAWVPDEQYQEIAATAMHEGTGRLKPIYLALNQEVPYDVIRLVVAHLQVMA